MIAKGKPTVLFSALKYINEEDIAKKYLGVNKIPCKIKSTFRQDNNPSLGLYYKNNHIYFKDFGTGDKGDIYDLLMLMYHKDYKDIAEMILNDIRITATPSTIMTHEKPNTGKAKLDVAIRDWKDCDREYWGKYYIDIKTLNKYRVFPVAYKMITKGNIRYTFAAPKLCYVFIENKDNRITKKIYSPLSRQYKWVTDTDSSVIGLYSKLPKRGNTLCICSSLKDALVLMLQSKIPCIYLQGEGFRMKSRVIRELKERFDNIFICFDNDEAGLKDAEVLAKNTGFKNVVLPKFTGGKDISDLIAITGIEKFKQIVLPLFN